MWRAPHEQSCLRRLPPKSPRCKHYYGKKCLRAPNCKFAHALADLRPLPDWYAWDEGTQTDYPRPTGKLCKVGGPRVEAAGGTNFNGGERGLRDARRGLRDARGIWLDSERAGPNVPANWRWQCPVRDRERGLRHDRSLGSISSPRAESKVGGISGGRWRRPLDLVRFWNEPGRIFRPGGGGNAPFGTAAGA